jgi:hypothetical protein
MKVRDLKYEGLSAWPPQPAGGAFDPHNPAPIPLDLENGILKDVAIAPPDGTFPSLVEIKVERHDGKLETRDLWVDRDDVAMILKLYSVLKRCKGRSLREVGDLDLNGVT